MPRVTNTICEGVAKAAASGASTRTNRQIVAVSSVLVWSFRVAFAPEGVERPLLRGGIGPWRTNGGALQRPMHAFMRAVLLRSSRMDALKLNAEPHPPDVEL
jgi:hypothetical protein